MKPKIDFISAQAAKVETPEKITSWKAEKSAHEHEIAVRRLKIAVLDIEVATHEYAANVLKDRIRGGKPCTTTVGEPQARPADR